MTSLSLDNLWTLMSTHEFKVEGDIPANVICGICRKLMIKPYSAPCECHFCAVCIQQYLQNGGRRCPGHNDRCGDIVLEIEDNVLSDLTIQSNIGKVVVQCQHSLCPMALEIENMESHMRVCTMICPYSTIGCGDSGTTNGTMTGHLNSEILCHSRLLMDAINNLRNDIDNITQLAERRDMVIESQRQQIEQLTQNEDRINTKIIELNEHLDSSKLEIEGCKLEIEEMLNKEMMNKLELTRHSKVITDIKKRESENGVVFNQLTDRCAKNDENSRKILELQNVDEIEIKELRKCEQDVTLKLEEITKKMSEYDNKSRIDQERNILDTDEIIKYKKEIRMEIENQKSKFEELSKKNEIDLNEVRKMERTSAVKMDEMKREYGKYDEKLKLEHENHAREVEALIKYKKEIRLEMENQKVKSDELQKSCKRNKVEIEKCKKNEGKCNNTERDSDAMTLMTFYKIEQDRLAREIMEMKQNEKKFNTAIGIQKTTTEELKKKDDSNKIALNNLMHQCQSIEVLPHIFRNQSMQEIQAIKIEMVEINLFKELKKQVIKNVKDIDVVRNALAKSNEVIKEVCDKKIDPDFVFDYVWTISDFSRKNKESEFISDPFIRGKYKLCLHVRLDGYNLCLSLCVLDAKGTKGPEWAMDNEFILGFISQYTLKPHSCERISYNKSGNKSHSKKCHSDISLCIGGPRLTFGDIINTPGLLANDTLMVYFSLLRNLI